MLILVPRISDTTSEQGYMTLSEILNDSNCKFGAKYINSTLSTIIEDCVKTIAACLKTNKDLVKQAKAASKQLSICLDSIVEFASLKRSDPESKRLVLYTAEIIRLLSESKDVLKTLVDKNRTINHIFDTLIYFNDLNKLQADKTVLNILRSVTKTFRNFIFSKIPIKRKNFIEDFIAVVQATRSDETVLVDNLRVLAKISELEKLALRVSSSQTTYDLIDYLLSSKSDYVLGGCLQLIGNCLAVSPDFGTKLYTPVILAHLLRIFERYCNRVS